jgi:hypothetical protein
MPQPDHMLEVMAHDRVKKQGSSLNPMDAASKPAAKGAIFKKANR